MALTLKALLEQEAHLCLTAAGEELNVVYRPAALTWETRGKLRDGLWAFVPEEDAKRPAVEVIPPALDAYCAVLAEVLVQWDAVDETGKVLPVDAATLKRFPFDFILSLGREVARDSLANPLIRATSANTSPTTGS